MSSFPVPASRIRSLATLLRASRLEAGLTQQEVAEAIDLHVGIYGRIERAQMMPSIQTLRDICAILRLDYEAVVSRVSSGESTLSG